MADTPRRDGPFVWASWLSGLLSGDKQCLYALWHRANFKFEKRQDSRENDLTVWKGEHSELVRRRAEELSGQGYVVTVEQQNKFYVNGIHATLSGCPDIKARSGSHVRIEDGKTGKRRDSDYWQVLIYMMFGPREDAADVVGGAVVYRDSAPRLIQPSEANEVARARVAAMIKSTASMVPLPATPSSVECGRCDILNCAHRKEEEAVVTVATEDF